MLSHRLLVVMIVLGCLFIGFNAEADCLKGYQPWTRTTSREVVCLPDKMVAYLVCLETVGGGKITVEQSDAKGSSKKVNVGLEGGGGTPLAKGQGKVTVDSEKTDTAIKKIRQQFDPKNNTNCFKASYGDSSSTSQGQSKKTSQQTKKGDKARKAEVQQSGGIANDPNRDSRFPKLVGNDVIFPAEEIENTTPGFNTGDKFYIAFHDNGWNPSKGDKRYEMQRKGDKLIAREVINKRFHPVLVSPRRWHKIEQAYSKYLPLSGEFKNNIDYTNPNGPCYCFGPNCVPYNQGGQ